MEDLKKRIIASMYDVKQECIEVDIRTGSKVSSIMEKNPLTKTDWESAIYNNAYIEGMNNVLIMIDHTDKEDKELNDKIIGRILLGRVIIFFLLITGLFLYSTN